MDLTQEVVTEQEVGRPTKQRGTTGKGDVEVGSLAADLEAQLQL